MPALQPYINRSPFSESSVAPCCSKKGCHPLSCHRPRIPDHLVFERLLQILEFGCPYWRIADESCSASTLRRRRDEWIKAGVMDATEAMALEAYDCKAREGGIAPVFPCKL